MKKQILTLCLFLAAGCSILSAHRIPPQTAAINTMIAPAASQNVSLPAVRSLSASPDTARQALKRMFIYNKKLYTDTGEISTAGRCGEMDGRIQKSVSTDKIPTKELQSNFGKGYDFQLGSRSNRLEVCIEDTWHIFAYNENNFDGVAMKVTQHTNTSAVVTVKNNSSQEVIFGEPFILEKKNYRTGEWRAVPYKPGDYGFYDPAYIVKKGSSVQWKASWHSLYGTLKPGTYRIVKEFTDSQKAGAAQTYTLSAKFRVKPSVDL